MMARNFFNRFSRVLITFWALNIVFLSPAFAQSGGYHNGRMGPWMMGDWGMGWFGMIMMLLFCVLVIAGIIFLIQRLVGSTGSTAKPSNHRTDSQAMDILKERYAKGEISREEFEAMKKDILH